MGIRVIPGYETYGVTKAGIVVSFESGTILRRYLFDGYIYVDLFKETIKPLRVHRLVALAWVVNPNPNRFTIVNHRDGIRINNWWENLEWTDYSGNNYHAINAGLRSDNIRCCVRDFYTKQVHEFASMAQAKEFMGLRKDVRVEQLSLKQFGALIEGRFEFRFANDSTPWLYENRTELVPPSRYMVVVLEPNGETREVYSNRDLLQRYQLYRSSSRSIPGLVDYGNSLYPDHEFSYRDSYAEEQHRVSRNIKSQAQPILAVRGVEELDFQSLTQCANHFDVDRSVIVLRLNSGQDLDGWTFTSMPL